MTASSIDVMSDETQRTGSLSPFEMLLVRVRRQPHLVLRGVLALLNGYLHRVKFFLSRKRVRIGRCFRVYGRLQILGPGVVEFGDYCMIESRILRRVTLITTNRSAEISLGDNVGLNGTVLHCTDTISVERDSVLADAYVIDSTGHALSADRRMIVPEDLPASPVRIGRNVWLSNQVTVLKGVSIGQNSVIGACSLVRKDVPCDVLAAGNPLRIIGPIPETFDRTAVSPRQSVRP